jgi:CelD/BcsL family acetyltransferase involved in cellulose biosynthesis
MSPERLKISLVDDATGLNALEAEWLALWRHVPEATPFQSPAWLVPWWQTFGQGELMAVALRHADALVGLVPLYILHEAGGRKLLPVGVGISDYLDPLLAPEWRLAAMRTLLGILGECSADFDVCDLPQQSAGSAWHSAPVLSGWSQRSWSCPPAPVLPLSDRTISGHRRNRLRYYRRRAEARGRVRIRPAEGSDLDCALGDLRRLHAARWRLRGGGGPGVLADERVLAFHGRAAPLLHAHGLLRLYLLEIDERVVAVFHTMTDGRRCHVYVCGFDPDLAEISPGKLVIGQIIDDALCLGLRELHFLRGQEAYKYEWGALDRPLLGLSLIPQPARLRRQTPVERAPVP